jgi:ABC-type proline/glycine betaine transport system substrate-binding protein
MHEKGEKGRGGKEAIIITKRMADCKNRENERRISLEKKETKDTNKIEENETKTDRRLCSCATFALLSVDSSTGIRNTNIEKVST